MALNILLPNGEVLAVQVYIDAGAGPVKWDGAVTATITGGATAANQVLEITALGTLVTTADFDSKVGSLTETAPATDTASSGLNGRLQRIAQRLTSLITALGSPFQAGGSIANTTFASTTIDGGNVVLGATTGAAIITDADGTLQRYLRGIIKLAITAGGWLVTAKDAGYQNSTWAVHHIPAANTQATITQASAGGSLKNVCLGLTATLASSSTTAPAAIQVTVSLIDGATGGTTYLWRTVISLPATAGAITSFNIKWPHGTEGTAATVMTLEFSAAGGTNTIESVSMYGTTRL